MLAVLAALLAAVLLLGGACVLLLCAAVAELGRVRAAVVALAAVHRPAVAPHTQHTAPMQWATPPTPEQERAVSAILARITARGVT